MATPGRSRPVKPTTDAAALRARLATMTYSFAQQMPTPPPRPVSGDPNFPHLPNSALPSAQQARFSAPGKPATAAEVVAARKPDVVKNDQEIKQNAKQQAELALYSKLVPTTSAVPRNPGRRMGRGGLRATGSVVAQKPRVTVPPTQPSLVQRKEPLTSRMQSLSSDASRPRLARKVAKPNRTPSTAPPPSHKSANGVGTSPSKERVKETAAMAPANTSDVNMMADSNSQAKVSTPIPASRPREVQTDSRDAYLKSIVSIYGNVDTEHSRPSPRTESTPSQHRPNDDIRQTLVSPTMQSRLRNSPSQARRLEEAFNNGGRYDRVRSPSPATAKQSQVGTPRRTSALSPPPIHPSLRRTSGREHLASKEENEMKKTMQEAISDAPPGFEGRSSTASRSSFAPRKVENDGPTNSKSFSRDAAPALPQNDRAGAFREAINIRKHSSSPRPAFRRISKGDPNHEGAQQPSGHRPSEKDGLRQHIVKSHLRSNSSSSKQNSTAATVSSEQVVRSKRKSDLSSARTKRDENFFERRMEQAGVSDVVSQGEQTPKVPVSTDEERFSRESTVLPSNEKVNRAKLLEGMNESGNCMDANHLTKTSVTKHEIGLESRVDPVAAHHSGGNIDECNETDSVGKVTADSEFRQRNLNGWDHQTNEVHCGNAEELVNGLLDQDDEDYMPPISAPMGNGPVGTSSMPGTSVVDLMRQLQVGSSLSSMMNNERCEDVLLPPLPNSEEDVRFESMLRSMGWMPPDEDEKTRGDGTGIIRETTSRALRVEVADRGVNDGLESVKNGNRQNPYYSHFQ